MTQDETDWTASAKEFLLSAEANPGKSLEIDRNAGIRFLDIFITLAEKVAFYEGEVRKGYAWRLAPEPHAPFIERHESRRAFARRMMQKTWEPGNVSPGLPD